MLKKRNRIDILIIALLLSVLILAVGYNMLFIVFGQSDTEINCEKQDYLMIEMLYKNGNFSVLNESLEKGCAPLSLSNKSYVYNLLEDKDVLFTSSFDPTQLFVDNEEESNMASLSEARFFLTVPSVKTAKSVEIYHEGERVFQADVYNIGARSCRED